MNELTEILKQIPKRPGIYMYQDTDNIVIYVGKAKNLFNRVNSYFKGKKDPKTEALVKKIYNIDFFITNSEMEALILENNLIKQYSPKYNIALKDSKSYPYIKVTKENLPRIYKTREIVNSTGIFFGPFVNSLQVDSIVSILNTVLKLRKCRKKFNKPYNNTVCLNYHIGLCSGPCNSIISEEEYLLNIKSATEYLKGNIAPLVKVLTEIMQKYSDELLFEQAGIVRDQIKQIQSIKEDQLMESSNNENSDFVGFIIEDDIAVFSIIIVRNGKVIDKKSFLFNTILSVDTLETDFISSYYLNTEFLPDKVFCIKPIDNCEIIAEVIKNKFNKKVIFQTPYLQKDKRLLKLSIDNAGIFYEEKKLQLDKIHHLRELKQILSLKTIPRYIECLDVATLDGKFNTGAISVFIDGEPDTRLYRQYNVKGECHPDDYSMIKEVIARRFQKIKVKKEKLPDLLIIDGGKGQLSSATEILDLLEIDIPVIGLAKKNEEIYTRISKNPIKLPERSYSLKILQAIRDESHRFSNTRLRARYENSTLTTELLKIEGVGKKRALLLLKRFKSINAIKNLTETEIASTEHVGPDLAKRIYEYFH